MLRGISTPNTLPSSTFHSPSVPQQQPLKSHFASSPSYLMTSSGPPSHPSNIRLKGTPSDTGQRSRIASLSYSTPTSRTSRPPPASVMTIDQLQDALITDYKKNTPIQDFSSLQRQVISLSLSAIFSILMSFPFLIRFPPQ